MTRALPPLVRLARVRELFQIHPVTVNRWAAAGHVTIYKRNGSSFICARELSDFITGGPTAQAQGAAP